MGKVLLPLYKIRGLITETSYFVYKSGVGGIRTLVPKKDKRISSAPHYDHFDTTPERFTLY